MNAPTFTISWRKIRYITQDIKQYCCTLFCCRNTGSGAWRHQANTRITVLSFLMVLLWSSYPCFLWSLQWRHNGRDSVSNHHPHPCLLNVYSGADQRKHQSSASLAFVRGIHRWAVNSPHKWPVTRKMFPFDDVIMVASVPFGKGCEKIMNYQCTWNELWLTVFHPQTIIFRSD